MTSTNAPEDSTKDEQPAALAPEVVSAILRDPDGTLYPCQIGVFCDDCGTTFEGDFMVSDDMTKPERLEAARAHLRTQGWSCTSDADLCPPCALAAGASA